MMVAMIKLYGMSELYAKNPRDACVMVAINNRIFDVYQVDEMLKKNDLDGLKGLLLGGMVLS